MTELVGQHVFFTIDNDKVRFYE
jgi:alpha-glucan,water dikinase